MSQSPQASDRDDRLVLLFECEVSDICKTLTAAGDRNREVGVKFPPQSEKITYILPAVRKLSSPPPYIFPGDRPSSFLLKSDIRLTRIQGGNFKERKQAGA